MAVTLFWCADYGTQTASDTANGGGFRGASRTTGISNLSHKNSEDPSVEYHTVPITASQNSYEIFAFAYASGSYNSISDGLFQHVTGVPGAGLTYKLFITGSGGYSTPATSTNALLTHTLNSTGLISTGYALKWGIKGPEFTGKNSSSTGPDAYSEYIITQLQTSVSASAGDTSVQTYQIRWSEN